MKKILKSYRHLIALALVISVAVIGFALQILQPVAALAIIGLWQVAQFAISKRQMGVFFISVLSNDQIEEFTEILNDIKKKVPGWTCPNKSNRWRDFMTIRTARFARCANLGLAVWGIRASAGSAGFPSLPMIAPKRSLPFL
ncbi:MAG TPA: hypothetical protein VMV89_03150 [Candidatus Paceibacterota bacterium]|nr:hypothetical protein [Candidatus Paceibacterota bacterium]